MVYKAALYCRLSKEDMGLTDGEVSESIRNQKLLLSEYALKQGWEIYDIYSDEDYRGFDRNRPAFNRMLIDGKNGRFNIVLCKHQSRFTRDIELVEEYIHGKFILWGIRFVSITDNIDTDSIGNKKARQINSLVNEWYSEDLSENIRSVFKKKMENGQYLAPFACYGYRKNTKDKHKLIIDYEAAAVVGHIFELYLQGYGTAKIAQILTESQIETPTQYKKRNNFNYYNPKADLGKGVWSGSTVKKILTNEIYIGTLIQGKERKISYKSKKTSVVPREQWIAIENNHEGIIERNKFDAVQSLMKERRRGRGEKSVQREDAVLPDIFLPKMKCRRCGSKLVKSGMTRDKSAYYYRCSMGIKTKGKECNYYICQDKIENAVNEGINEMIQSFLKNNAGNSLETADRDLERMEKKECLLIEELAQIYKQKVTGEISIEDFKAAKRKISSCREEIGETKSIYKKDNFFENRNNENYEKIIYEYLLNGKLNDSIISDFINCIEIEENIEEDTQHIYIHWDF